MARQESESKTGGNVWARMAEGALEAEARDPGILDRNFDSFPQDLPIGTRWLLMGSDSGRSLLQELDKEPAAPQDEW